MPGEDIKRVHVIVEGRVQGVGFRYFVHDIADGLGINGWVRNRWDETVEVMAEGNPADLDKLLVALSRGPRSAYVSNLQVEWSVATGEFNLFRIALSE